MRTPIGCAVFAMAALAGSARADVTYSTQARSITATTSANANTETITAPDFGPFVQNLHLSTMFPTPAGGTAPNEAVAGIECVLDPNAIRVIGSLAGSGGLSLVGGMQTLEFGEAQAAVDTRFSVDNATPFTMTASPRPSTRPGDRFQIKLKNEGTHEVIIDLDQSMPPQAVNLSGMLEPGTYEFEYQVELTVDGPETLRDFSFNMSMGTQCYANCDGSTVEPLLNVNDFVCFLTRFAQGDPYANCDASVEPPLLNINDFLCFQGRFVAGCTQP